MIEEIRYIVLIYQVHIHIRDSSIYPLNSSRTGLYQTMFNCIIRSFKGVVHINAFNILLLLGLHAVYNSTI